MADFPATGHLVSQIPQPMQRSSIIYGRFTILSVSSKWRTFSSFSSIALGEVGRCSWHSKQFSFSYYHRLTFGKTIERWRREVLHEANCTSMKYRLLDKLSWAESHAAGTRSFKTGSQRRRGWSALKPFLSFTTADNRGASKHTLREAERVRFCKGS